MEQTIENTEEILKDENQVEDQTSNSEPRSLATETESSPEQESSEEENIETSKNPETESLNSQEEESDQLEIINTDEYRTRKEDSSLHSIASALKNDLKAQVEAVLFVSDSPLKAGAISKMLNTSYEDVQSALVKLIQEYEDRNGGLEIGTDDGYIIQVKTQYLNIVTDMMPLELNAGPMRTLSAIALKEPVLQSEVIDMRGSGAYDHIHDLVEMDLVTKKPQGMSYLLKTTQKFQQYFRLTQDANKIKVRLQEEASRRAKEKAAIVDEIPTEITV